MATVQNLPHPGLLDGMKEVGDTEPEKAVDASQTSGLEPPALELVGSNKRQPNNKPSVTKSHFLPAPGLPTISNKLAQKI